MLNSKAKLILHNLHIYFLLKMLYTFYMSKIGICLLSHCAAHLTFKLDANAQISIVFE